MQKHFWLNMRIKSVKCRNDTFILKKRLKYLENVIFCSCRSLKNTFKPLFKVSRLISLKKFILFYNAYSLSMRERERETVRLWKSNCLMIIWDASVSFRTDVVFFLRFHGTLLTNKHIVNEWGKWQSPNNSNGLLIMMTWAHGKNFIMFILTHLKESKKLCRRSHSYMMLLRSVRSKNLFLITSHLQHSVLWENEFTNKTKKGTSIFILLSVNYKKMKIFSHRPMFKNINYNYNQININLNNIKTINKIVNELIDKNTIFRNKEKH